MPTDPRRAEPAPDYSVWKIAGGILLALVIWNGYDRWQTNRAIKAYNAEIARVFDPAEIDRRSRAMFPQIAAAREHTEQVNHQRAVQAQNAHDAAALKPDERCINQQRFRRVTNGWEQIGSC